MNIIVNEIFTKLSNINSTIMEYNNKICNKNYRYKYYIIMVIFVILENYYPSI